VPEPGKRALEHLLRAAQELTLALAAGASAIGGNQAALERLRAALRAEEQRWASLAANDLAAERVREIFAALCDVLAPDERARKSPERGRFDRPGVRWDTGKRWRS
jgi:hypothetical protein